MNRMRTIGLLIMILSVLLFCSAMEANGQSVAIKTVTTLPSTCRANAQYTQQIFKKAADATRGFYTCKSTQDGWDGPYPTAAAGAPTNATYITQTANSTLSAEQAMGALATGLVKNAATTGVQSIATATDVSTPLLCDDAGANDTYTCTAAPAIAAYVAGQFFIFKPNTANTGAATLNINGKGAIALKKLVSASVADPADNDLRASGRYVVVYDGTEFLITSLLGNSTSGCTPNATVPMILNTGGTQVDLNEGTDAKQAIYTCPASRRCIVTDIVMQKFSDVQAVSFTMGWTEGADDLTPTITIGGFLGGLPYDVTTSFNFATPDALNGVQLLIPRPPVGSAGDVLGLVVDVPAGSPLTARVEYIGYQTDTSGVPISNVCTQ